MADLVNLSSQNLGGVIRQVGIETRHQDIPGVFEEMDQVFADAGLVFAGPQTALYRPVDGMMEVAIGVPMDDLIEEFDRVVAEQGTALCLRHRGAFDGLKTVYPKLHAAARDRGLTPTGSVREVYRLVARDATLNVTDVYLDVHHEP